MDCDELNQTHTDQRLSWVSRFYRHYGDAGVEKLASTYRDGRHCRCVFKTNGSFNLCYKVIFDDGQAWAVRFPIPGQVMHPEEKIRREVAVLKFLREKTKVPVPGFVAFGTASENHDPEIGPFLITEWVEGVPLSTILTVQPEPEASLVLRDDIDPNTLHHLYSQVAEILLELASHNFDKIGSLEVPGTDDSSAAWLITTRPMTQRMNEIESDGFVIVDDHTAPPYQTAAGYYENLLRQNMKHLYEQRNSVDDAEDARKKFIFRRQLQALLPYFTSEHEAGPFKLYCDDLQPHNILVDKDTHQITAVIDWEWTYAAPYEFAYIPPRWLAARDPCLWFGTTEATYMEQLPLFLKALEDVEERRAPCMITGEESYRRMSATMRRNFENGTFWWVQLMSLCFLFDDGEVKSKMEEFVRVRGLLGVGIPDEAEIDEFVALKMRHLEAYNQELQIFEKNKEQQEVESGEQSRDNEVDGEEERSNDIGTSSTERTGEHDEVVQEQRDQSKLSITVLSGDCEDIVREQPDNLEMTTVEIFSDRKEDIQEQSNPSELIPVELVQGQSDEPEPDTAEQPSEREKAVQEQHKDSDMTTTTRPCEHEEYACKQIAELKIDKIEGSSNQDELSHEQHDKSERGLTQNDINGSNNPVLEEASRNS